VPQFGRSQPQTERSEGLRRAAETGAEIISTKMAEDKKETKVEEKPVEEAKVEAKVEEKVEEKPVEKKEEKKKDKKEEKKVDIVSETIYTIPLSLVHRTKPHYKRASKASKFVQKYLVRHTKSENIVIENTLNQYLWARGASKPPRKVQIKAVKDSEGKVVASLLK
jgi:large subunit ribosomal protein L31e